MHNKTSILGDAELDLASGGKVANYKRCEHGTTAGGTPGLYADKANCAVTIGELIGAFKDGISIGTGGKY